MESEGGGYDLAGQVIGLAMRVHSALGPGFQESVYENALAVELDEAGLSYQRQTRIDVRYKDRIVDDFICDFLVDGKLIVELKATLGIVPAHEVQTVNYLTATGINGLLLNFGASKLQFKKKYRHNHSVNSVHSVKNASAFTMLELLVSMAVLSLLVVLLLSMVDNATKMWRQSENRVDAYREARAALNLMASDLASIYTATNTNFFRMDDAGITLSPAKISTASSGGNGATDSIFFITALPSKAQDPASNKSDLCEVGYYLAWSSTSVLPNSTNRSQNLHRFFRSSDTTFKGLTNNSQLSNSSDPGGGEEVLAKNITGFKVTAYSKDPGTPGKLTPFNQSTTTPSPDVLEITLSAISNDAAKRLEDENDWKNIDPVTRKQIERTFTKRVVLNRDAAPTPAPTP